MRAFVADGGGLIGIGAPSHYRAGGLVWQLAPVLGVEFADSARDGEGDSGAFSRFDSAFLDRGPKPSRALPMLRVGSPHFITEQLPERSEPILCKVTPKVVRDDTEVLGSGAPGSFAPPLLAVNSYHGGRAVYINGYSGAHDYGRMLRRAIFWSARREDLYPRLAADDAGVMTYLYPGKRLLVVYNQTPATVATAIRMDPALLGIGASRRIRITNVLGGGTETVLASAMAAGITRSLPMHGTEFLRIESAP